jgi:hypothetical protein
MSWFSALQEQATALQEEAKRALEQAVKTVDTVLDIHADEAAAAALAGCRLVVQRPICIMFGFLSLSYVRPSLWQQAAAPKTASEKLAEHQANLAQTQVWHAGLLFTPNPPSPSLQARAVSAPPLPPPLTESPCVSRVSSTVSMTSVTSSQGGLAAILASGSSGSTPAPAVTDTFFASFLASDLLHNLHSRCEV